MNHGRPASKSVPEETKGYYEYLYSDAAPIHHHSYVARAVMQLSCDEGYPPAPAVRVLDLGSGNGSLSGLLARLGYTVTGLDSSNQGIRMAREMFPDVVFVLGDISHLPPEFTRHSYDVVLAIEVIEHFFSPGELVRAAKECLRPQGRLVLSTEASHRRNSKTRGFLGNIEFVRSCGTEEAGFSAAQREKIQ